MGIATRRLVFLVSVFLPTIGSSQDRPGERFSAFGNFPAKAVGYVSISNVTRLKEKLSETLYGSIATHPGIRATLAEGWDQVERALERETEEFTERTGISLLDFLVLFRGEVSLVVGQLAPSPEIALAVELTDAKNDILQVLGRIEAMFVEFGGTVSRRNFGSYEAKLLTNPAGPILHAVLGTHLVLTNSETLLTHATNVLAGQADGPNLAQSELFSGLAEKIFIQKPEVRVALDVTNLRESLLRLSGADRDKDVMQILRATGLGRLARLGHSLGFRDQGMEDALHLELEAGKDDLFAVIEGSLRAVEGVDAALSRVPVQATEIGAVHIRTGHFLRELGALVRRALPQAAGELDTVYEQLEAQTNISVRREIFTLGDLALYGFSVTPPAGGLFSDPIVLVRSRELEPYWDLATKLGASQRVPVETLRSNEGTVSYLNLGRGLSEGSTPGLGGFGMSPSFAELGIVSALANMSGFALLARTDLDDGWTAFSSAPQALVRYLHHYHRDAKLPSDLAFHQLVREKLEGARGANVSRDAFGVLAIYNSLVSLADAFAPILAMAGIDPARFPPGETFLDGVKPGFIRLDLSPTALHIQGHRGLESSGGVIVAVGAASVVAGFIVPQVFRGRGAAYKVQCANNLKQLYTFAMHYSDTSGTRAFPHDPDGSVASFQKMIDHFAKEGQGGLAPKLFLCPEGHESEAEVDEDGRILLTEETCGYEIANRRIKNTALNKILMYDKHPHGGGRNVLMTDASIQFMQEAEFQRRLAAE